MSNMGYVRFENTLSDLQDCYEHMDDELTPREQRLRDELIGLCVDIVADYNGFVNQRINLMAQGMEALVKKWRNHAEKMKGQQGTCGIKGEVYSECANELDQLLEMFIDAN